MKQISEESKKYKNVLADYDEFVGIVNDQNIPVVNRSQVMQNAQSQPELQGKIPAIVKGKQTIPNTCKN